jgi:hypothetical protein
MLSRQCPRSAERVSDLVLDHRTVEEDRAGVSLSLPRHGMW